MVARVDGDHLAAGGLLERIVAWAGQVVGTPSGYICLIEPATGEMVLRLGTGTYAGLVGLRMLKGEGLSGRVWATGEALAIPDYSRWDGRVRQIATDENMRGARLAQPSGERDLVLQLRPESVDIDRLQALLLGLGAQRLGKLAPVDRAIVDDREELGTP